MGLYIGGQPGPPMFPLDILSSPQDTGVPTAAGVMCLRDDSAAYVTHVEDADLSSLRNETAIGFDERFNIPSPLKPGVRSIAVDNVLHKGVYVAFTGGQRKQVRGPA